MPYSVSYNAGKVQNPSRHNGWVCCILKKSLPLFCPGQGTFVSNEWALRWGSERLCRNITLWINDADPKNCCILPILQAGYQPGFSMGAGGFLQAQFVLIALFPSHAPFISFMAFCASWQIKSKLSRKKKGKNK